MGSGVTLSPLFQMIVVLTIVAETMPVAPRRLPCPTLRCSDRLPGIVEKSWIADPLDSSLERCALVSLSLDLGREINFSKVPRPKSLSRHLPNVPRKNVDQKTAGEVVFFKKKQYVFSFFLRERRILGDSPLSKVNDDNANPLHNSFESALCNFKTIKRRLC